MATKNKAAAVAAEPEPEEVVEPEVVGEPVPAGDDGGWQEYWAELNRRRDATAEETE